MHQPLTLRGLGLGLALALLVAMTAACSQPAPQTTAPTAPTTAPAAAPAAKVTAPAAPAAQATALAAAPAAKATEPAAAKTQAATAVQRGGTVRGACVAAITSLDPATSKLGVCDSSVYNLLYNTLVRTSTTAEVKPELATAWEVSPDGKTYTFKLRPDVKFHDGTPLDAEAVKFSLERIIEPNSVAPGAATMRVIDKIEVVDPQTVRIVLKAPSAPFLAQLGSGLNSAIVSPTAVKKLGQDFQRQAVGSGPFKIAAWTPGDKATFERFDGYWEMGADGKALPYLDKVELNGVPDESVRLLNLRSGQFELNERLNPKDVASVKNDPNLQLVDTATSTYYQVAMNPTKPPFDNKALRQAVSAALNRPAIIQNVGYGTGYTSPMPYAKGTWFFIDNPSPKFDVAEAKKKLAEAGFPNGTDVQLSIISRPIDQQIAQIVKANLDEVGIRTTIEALERTAWVDKWNARQGQMGILQRGAGPVDPDEQSVFFDPKNTANFAGYNSEKAWDLTQRARQLSSQAERRKLYEELAQTVVDDAVYVFMGAVPVTGSASAKVKDVAVGPGSEWLLTRTWLSK